MLIDRWRPALALVAVFAVKLLVVVQVKDHVLLQEEAGLDTTIYLELARRVTAGDLWLAPGLYFVSPLYIYFCALLLALTDSTVSIRVVQVALGTATVAFVFLAARMFFGRGAAWISGAITALTGLFTFYEVLLLQAALDPFLTAAALAALARALTEQRPGYAVLAGALFGAQVMNRPNILLAVAGLCLVMVAMRHRRTGALAALGLGLALSPLLIRNAVVTGHWGPLTSHGGLNFYIGNHAAADGTYKHVEGIRPSIAGQQEDARRVAGAAFGRPVTDAEASSYFYQEAWKWIRGDPAAALGLWLTKMHLTVSSQHLWLNYSYPFFAYDTGTILAALFVGPWILVPLGLLGLLAARPPQRSAYLAWVSFVPLYWLSVSVFFVSERYRLPLLIPFATGAGAFVWWIGERIRARDSRRLVGAALAAAGVAAAVNWPLALDDGRGEERLRMIEALLQRGRVDEAKQWIGPALEAAPSPALAHFRIGRALAASGDVSVAAVHLEQAAKLDPGRPEVSYALGQVLLESGRASAAVPHLRRAFEAGVRTDVAGFDLARALAAISDRDGALVILEQVTPASESDSASWYALGQLAERLSSPALAADRYRRAAEAAPQSAEPRERYGLMLGLTGDFEGAARQLDRAMRVAPGDASIRLNLAVVLARLGELDAARQQAREALRLDPQYQKAKDLLQALSK